MVCYLKIPILVSYEEIHKTAEMKHNIEWKLVIGKQSIYYP